MISESLKLEVPFFDVDSMRVVWHGHYCKYFEEARCKLLEKIGYDYHVMAASDYSFPVVDMRIKYLESLKFGQHLVVKATLIDWEVRIKIEYEVIDAATQRKMTSGYTVQAVVARADGKMQLQTPQVFTNKIQALLDAGSY